MSFFQNPFTDEYRFPLLLGDRHYSPTFVMKPNAGREKEAVVAWTAGPYNMSGNDTDGNSCAVLKICFRLHSIKNWATMSVTTTTGAASTSAVTEAEVAASLNADTLFRERFVAHVSGYGDNAGVRLQIRQRKPITEFEFYIVSGQAEEKMNFNKRAGVAELPTFFARHTIANRFTYPDSQGRIIQLNPGSANVDAAIINGAVDAYGKTLGYSSSTVKKDWELLAGSSGIFQFKKGPSANVVTTTEVVIEYSAGAVAGDLARKITTKKDASAVVVTYFEEPYTLTSGDLITPP
jgi:hypothetical protein